MTRYVAEVSGKRLEVDASAERLPDGEWLIRLENGRTLRIRTRWTEEGWVAEAEGRFLSVRVSDERERAQASAQAGQVRRALTLRAPMPGIVTRVEASPGQEVKTGDLLLVLEAMKMANEIRSAAPGRVASVPVSAGQTVAAGQPLLTLE